MWHPFQNKNKGNKGIQKKWPIIDFNIIKKRSRILVVDDEDFPYEQLFKKDGYNVDKWDDIDDLPKLEDGYYDLILLDLQGVGLKQTKDQGLGILRHLKERNPTQMIVAYSNASWPVEYQSFFKDADDTLSKATDYIDFKNVVDSHMRKRYSLEFYLDKIEQISRKSDVSHEVLISIREKAKEAIFENKTSILNDYLQKEENQADIGLNEILAFTQVAIGIYQACNS